MSKAKKTVAADAEAAKIDLGSAAKIGLLFVSALLFIYDVFYLLPSGNPSVLDRIKTIVLFIVMSYCFGYTILSFVKKPEDVFERNFMTLGIGLGVIPIVTLILSTFHVPLDATLLLLLSLLYPTYVRLKAGGGRMPKVSQLFEHKSALTLSIVIFLASVYLYVLLKGGLTLPYLEDDDSWDHAIGAKYVSIAKTYELPEGVAVTHYLEPYPPVYDGLMGILLQYNSSVQWTLKFFNALLIGLSIITAYYFMRLFTGDDRIALGGSFILTVVPCYLSHFIWAHTLGHVLFYPALYAAEMVRRDRKWILPAAMCVASVIVAQPMVTVIFGLIFLLYYITRAVFEKNLLKEVFTVGLVGVLLAVVFFWGQMVVKYGTGFDKIDNAGNRIKSGEFKIAFEKRTIPLNEILLVESSDSMKENCATLIPGKLCVPLSGNIAIQKGFGVIVFLLFTVSLLLLIARFKKETENNAYWIPVSIVWALFCLVGLESWALPFSADPPRFFMFLTLPLAVIVPKGVLMLSEMLKKYIKTEYLIALLFVAVLYTSAYPKYVVQTAMWPYGVMWLNSEHVQGYITIKEKFPADSMMFPLCMGDNAVIGMDKLSLAWDNDVLNFRQNAMSKSPSEIYNFLKSKGYEYLILDLYCIKKCSSDQNNVRSMDACTADVNRMAEQLSNHTKFTPSWSNNAVLLYKLN